MTAFYPIFLNLRGRPCAVVGGGGMAEQKVLALLDAGASVTVIAPQVTPALENLAFRAAIRLVRRPYERGDLEGMLLAIAASEQRSVNPAIWEEAEERGVILNAVDDLPHCHFIAPAIHRHGSLTVAISTEGKSPAVAVRLRERLAGLIGPEYGVLVDLLGEMRGEIAARIPDFATRTALWYRLVDSDAIDLIRGGDVSGARRRLAVVVEAAGRPEQHDRVGAVP